MIGSRLGHSLDPAIFSIYRLFFRNRRINPNVITLLGFAFSFPAFAAIALDHPVFGGIFLLLSGFLDLVDGVVARLTGRTTDFGGFLDSVLDRYSDLIVMAGILIYFMKKGSYPDVVAALAASTGIAIIPYARARAEAAGFSCRTGLLERPERLALLLCGLFFNTLLHYVVFALAVFSHVTVLQRIFHVMRQSKGAGRPGDQDSTRL